MPEPTSQPSDQAAETEVQGDPATEDKVPPRHVPVAELAEERAKRKELQARLDELERANETALEKAQREAQELRETATTATLEALRFRIAAEAGITDNVDLILTAPDEETMRRQARLWVDRAPATAGPKPDLTQGGSGQPLALNSDGLEDALRSKLGIA